MSAGGLLSLRVPQDKRAPKRRPVLGILTVPSQTTQTFRGNRANFRDIAQMGERMGWTVAVFTPEGLWNHGERVQGYVYQGSGSSKGQRGWQRTLLPRPVVVYNRVPDRRAEQRPSVERAKRWLEEQGIPMFNPQFFDKRSLCECLQRSSETASYLPHTIDLESEGQIASLLRRYKLLYAKPVDGKAGDGIVQIRQLKKGYQVTCQTDGKRTREWVASRDEAAKVVWASTKGHAYLLQQGVELAKQGGHPFDLRLLVQKNRYGIWRVTGMGARVADEDGITTHVPNGGRIEKASLALTNAFGKSKGKQIYQQAQEFALLAARTLEGQFAKEGATFGEMSMDIGVGKDGSLWFFEANAKPMKFDEPYIRARSLIRLVQYAGYLATHGE